MKGVPNRLQSKGPVVYVWRVSTPTVEMEELENSGKTENVAPVSNKKEMGLPDTDSVTLNSEAVMVVGATDPGPCQSLVARTSRFSRPRFG